MALCCLAAGAPAPQPAPSPVPPPSPATPQAAEPVVPLPPSIEFGGLYEAVEMAEIFPDQKTFADAVPHRAPAAILAEWRQMKDRPGFSLADFVVRNFMVPARNSVSPKPRPDQSVAAYIEATWSTLERQPDEIEPFSSLLPLPHPYIVPGGRFSEIYYWDSFFTMLGLEQDGHADLARDMLANMASLISRYGHIPNGNRSYYLSRSEPPFFPEMVELVARHEGDGVIRANLPLMREEYDYWMEGAQALAPGQAHRHAVRLADGTVLNRYWDDRATPRDEAFREDVDTARRAHGRQPEAVWRDLRAGAETGWDFSSRWLADPHDLATIRTTALAPVDLNCLMVHMEETLARAYQLTGDARSAASFRDRAAARAAAIRRLMWDAQSGTFQDLLWQSGRRTGIVSAATVVPLYFHVAAPEQAAAVAAALRGDGLLQPGGLATTLVASGQQWDRPNGWAPLQYMAIEGLRAYGAADLAGTTAARWIEKDIRSYAVSGTLLEKYDVEQSDTPHGGGGGGGEYPLQFGFGWTNGVLAVLMAEYPAETHAATARHPAAAAPGR
jgi:alpha,alpha-trehalase